MKARVIQKRNRSTFNKWVIYYTLILIFPLVIGLFVYLDTVDIVNNQVEKVHEASLNQLKIILDGKMSEIYQIGREISINEKVQSLVYKKPPADSEILYAMHEIRKDLVKYMISNKFIKSIGIYFQRIDCLMTDNDTVESDRLREIVENTFSVDYDTWLEKTSQYNYKDFVMAGLNDENGQAAESIVLFQTVSMPDGAKSPLATMMILIDMNEYERVLKSIQTTEEELFVRDNSSGQIVGTGDTRALEELMAAEAEFEEKGSLQKQYRSRDLYVTHIRSELADWDYIMVLPSDIYLQKVKHFKTVIIVYVSACLIAGFALAYYLARKSYDPLKNLIQSTIQKVGGAYPANLNEYGFLEHSLNALVFEKEDFRSRLKNQSETIRGHLIVKLVKGGYTCSENFIAKCKSNGIYFPHEGFMVMTFMIEEIGQGFLKDGEELNEKTLELVNFIVRNITEEMVNEKYTGCMAEVDGMPVCIVNFQKTGVSDKTTNDISNELIYLSMNVQNIMRQYYDINMFTAISGIYSEMADIPKAYEETLEIIEYRNLVGKEEKVMQYHSVRNEFENSPQSSKIIDSERQFMNLIIKGDYKNAQLLLNDIFSYYTPQNLPSLQIAKCRIFSLVNCMLNSMGEIKSAVDIDFFEELDPVQRLLRSRTIYELKSEVNYIFNSIAHYFEQKNAKNMAPKITKILDYIQIHHTEFDLSACTIADQFDISTSYLSRIFNKSMSMGLVDYIHKVRLDNAKILMRTNLSIKDIATKVGYNSSLALIRAFKKYEGTTPGKYREA